MGEKSRMEAKVSDLENLVCGIISSSVIKWGVSHLSLSFSGFCDFTAGRHP